MATMFAPLPFSSRRALNPEFWRRNPPLVALVLAMLVVAAVALLGLVVDPRVIAGAPAWMKPLKFAVSIAIYGATLLWMLTFIPGPAPARGDDQLGGVPWARHRRWRSS